MPRATPSAQVRDLLLDQLRPGAQPRQVAIVVGDGQQRHAARKLREVDVEARLGGEGKLPGAELERCDAIAELALEQRRRDALVERERAGVDREKLVEKAAVGGGAPLQVGDGDAGESIVARVLADAGGEQWILGEPLGPLARDQVGETCRGVRHPRAGDQGTVGRRPRAGRSRADLSRPHPRPVDGSSGDASSTSSSGMSAGSSLTPKR